MLRTMMRSVRVLILLPLVALVLAGGFWFGWLNGPQRAALWDRLVAILPGVRSLVSVRIPTHVAIESVQSAGNLKVASMAVDYLSAIQRQNPAEGGGTKNFIGIYSFYVEAGFDLAGASGEVQGGADARSLRLRLPAPRVLNVDQDDAKGALVLRDQLDGKDYEPLLKPLLVAFERLARDHALERGLLETAAARGRDYFARLYGGTFSAVEVTCEPVPARGGDLRSLRLPVRFALDPKEFDYRWEPELTFEPRDGVFRAPDGREIEVAYAGRSGLSIREWRELGVQAFGGAPSILFRDPAAPAERMSLCWLWNDRESWCLRPIGEELFLSTQVHANADAAARHGADNLYLSFRLGEAEQPPAWAEYRAFLRGVNEANSALDDRLFPAARKAAQRVAAISSESVAAKVLLDASEVLAGGSDSREPGLVNEPLDLLLAQLAAVRRDDLAALDTAARERLMDVLDKEGGKEAAGAAAAYFLIQNKRLQLSPQEFGEQLAAAALGKQLDSRLLEALSPTETQRALAFLLQTTAADARQQGARSGLYCGLSPQEVLPIEDPRCREAAYFYDQEALEEVFKKGAETAERVLAKKLPSVSGRAVVAVLTGGRAWNLRRKFDAVVVSRDAVWGIRDILEDAKDCYTSLKDINPSTTTDVCGESHQNPILPRVLAALHQGAKAERPSPPERLRHVLQEAAVARVRQATQMVAMGDF